MNQPEEAVAVTVTASSPWQNRRGYLGSGCGGCGMSVGGSAFDPMPNGGAQATLSIAESDERWFAMTRALKRILVGVDDSPAARSAVDEAVILAVQEGAELVFAHVFPLLGDELVLESKEATHVPESSTTPSLKDAEERAQLGGVQCTLELLVGYPPKELALRADELDVDLIVVGSRRSTGIKRALLGSTSRSLLSESNRPILVVPYVGVEETASI